MRSWKNCTSSSKSAIDQPVQTHSARAIVGEAYGTLDILRDAIRDEEPESFKSALQELRDLLTQLEASVLRSH